MTSLVTGDTAAVSMPAPHPEASRDSRLSRPRDAWRRVPLQVKLLAIVVVLLVAALSATGWTTQHVLRDYLVSQVDAQLAANAKLDGRSIVGATPGALPTQYVGQINFDSGASSEILGSPTVDLSADALPAIPELTSRQAQSRGARPFTVTAHSGHSGGQWRVVMIPWVIPQTGATGSIGLALPLANVDSAVNRVRVVVVALGALMGLAGALLAWLAIRRAFVPLVRVEETAAAIAGGDLSRRMPPQPAATEVGRLTTSLNTMLGRIEEAFNARAESEARTRRFAADASHELRTPLASIRGYAELYRQGAVSEPDDVRRSMSRIEDEARRMGSLVDDLLLLARLDEQRAPRQDPVDLAVLAGDAVLDVHSLDTEREVRLVGLRPDIGPRPALITGDEDRLRQVVANLVGNAVRHTPAGSPIELAVGIEQATGPQGPSELAVLEVRDHGAGLAPEHAERVFERFYRVDSSRSRGGGRVFTQRQAAVPPSEWNSPSPHEFETSEP